MSHPILVEAIETEFIPVLIYNNKKGKDAELLKSFSEPSWNNPVVRYLDGNGDDLIARRDRVWKTTAVAGRMIDALTASKRPVPVYLRSLVPASPTKQATFAMHCYWEGEAKLGSIEGVVGTRSGWLAGLEVVTVVYQPETVNYSKLLSAAMDFECASKVFAHDETQLAIAKKLAGSRAVAFPKNQKTRDAKASDQKYYLAQTALIHLPLTEHQATMLNAAVKAKTDWRKILSSRQKEYLSQIVSAQKNAPQATSKLLQGMTYPVDSSELATYQKELKRKLASLKQTLK